MIPFHNQEGFDPFQFEKVLLKITNKGKMIQFKRVYCDFRGNESYKG